MTQRIMQSVGAALALLTCVASTTLPQSSTGTAFRELSVSIPSGDGRVLAGTLTLPRDGDGPFPVALTVTGSGAHLRDGNRTPQDSYRPFRQIATTLATRGIATLRLDDRGAGQSTGSAAATDGDDVADDTRVAIAWLRRHARIDSGRVALIGHSFGGAIAPIVAASDARVAAMVLLGSPARSFRETMRYQLGYTIATDARISASGRAAALEAAMEQQERNVAASAERWRQWLQDYDPLPVAARVRSPVLILHGRTDRAVPPKDADDLAAAIRSGGNAQLMLRFFDNTNHHFQRDSIGAREGYDRLPTQDVSPEVLVAIADWLTSTLGTFVAGSVTVDGRSYPYSIRLPAGFDPTRRQPAMLVLHGAGSRGTDGLAPRRQSVVEAAQAHPERYPALLILPQCPPNRRWEGAMLRVALAALDSTMRRYAIDSSRVYLAGQSMGGDGVFELASAHRDRFAAAVVAAVGWGEPPFSATRLRTLPLWVFHGTADAIPVQRARDRVAALQRAGSTSAKLTELAGRDHEIFDDVYRDPAVPRWLFSHSR